MTQDIKVGIRPSLLAQKQFEEIQRRYPSIIMTAVSIRTTGDRDKMTPLTSVENTSFFTDKIEQALLAGSIDLAIHSAKDLDTDIHADLTIIATTKTISPFDCLVSYAQRTLDQLLSGARIGTSSQTRKNGILCYRGDLIVKDIRGNVDDRLRQLDRGEFEAIIVAEAALIRLGLRQRMAQVVPTDIIQPHPLQGRLAIQIKRHRNDLRRIFEGCDER